jgi:Protein of unknown function (DUF2939)
MRRLVTPIAVLLALAFAVWVYFAPHLTVRSMRLAAEAGDAQALSRHVDFPALRESVKQQLSKELGTQIAGLAGGSELGRFGAQIAGVLGNNALDQAVDAMVRPETLSAMFAGRDLANEYSLLPSGEASAYDGNNADNSAPASQDSGESGLDISDADIRATMGYESLGRFAINVQEPRSGRQVKLILTRDMLLWWKLSEVELPSR